MRRSRFEARAHRHQADEVPTPKNAHVAKQMRQMSTKDSKPEMQLRRALHALGLRYRLHRKDLPGKPDIVFPSARIAVFVDGCFWHRCPDHYVAPKNNAEFWETKIAKNVERDRRQDAELAELGWESIRIWEHEDVVASALAIQKRLVDR